MNRNFRDSQSLKDLETESYKRYLRDIEKFKFLSAEEEFRMFQEYRDGKLRNKDKIIQSYYKFVVSIARNYNFDGVELQDLIQQGNIGLITAFDLFDETKGFRYYSFAKFYIYKEILNFLNENYRYAKLPTIDLNQRKAIDNFINKYLHENECMPSLDLICHEFNIKEESAVIIMYSFNVGNCNAVQSDDGDSVSYIDDLLISDSDIETEYDSQHNRLLAKSNLTKLSYNESYILKLYYGIDCNDKMSIEAIAELLNMSKNDCNDIKDRALLKLIELC